MPSRAEEDLLWVKQKKKTLEVVVQDQVDEDIQKVVEGQDDHEEDDTREDKINFPCIYWLKYYRQTVL